MVRGLIVTLLACGLAGCAKPPQVGTVTGTVLLGGKPVTAGQIAFIPEDGRTYQGEIQANGVYRVDGVPIGEAIVVIHPPPPDEASTHMNIKESKDPPPVPAGLAIPKKYTDPATTDLKFTIKLGANEYTAELRR